MAVPKGGSRSTSTSASSTAPDVVWTEVVVTGVTAAPSEEGSALDRFMVDDVIVRIKLVREGVPSQTVQDAAAALGWSKEKLYDALGIARATVDRKIRRDRLLSPSESERVLGLVQMLRHAIRMYQESGNPDAAPGFDPARWLGAWLDDPNPALGRERPAAFLDTAEGRGLVDRLLEAMRAGTYW